MNRIVVALLFLTICAVGAAQRLEGLGRRPMHTDEAVQAVKLGGLLESGRYRYDPTEYHGPTLYYAAFAWARLRGKYRLADVAEADLRGVTAAFGGLLVAACWWLFPPLRRTGLFVAGGAVALNPFLVFYSKYFIQESLLVFFTAGLVAYVWRYVHAPSGGRAAMAGLFVGLMFATKETAVLTWAAMLPAVAAALPGRGGLVAAWRRAPHPAAPRHAAIAALVALGVAVFFFSSGFAHWGGLADSVAAFGHFARRAGGQGHEKPWWYYLRLVFFHRAGPLGVWSQWPLAVFGLLGAAAAVRRSQSGDPALPLARFAAVFSLSLLGIYSAIPYKTPWLMLTPLWGLCLLAGLGAQAFWDWRWAGRPWVRYVLLAILAAGAADFVRQNRWMQGRYAADTRNPCVYEHTSTDILNGVRLIDEAARAAAESGGDADGLVCVVADEYWPLPWYLRNLPRVGYWNRFPNDLTRPPAVVVTNPSRAAEIESSLAGPYSLSLVGLRPIVALTIYVRDDVWQTLLSRRAGAASP